MSTGVWQNWAGDQRCSPARVVRPADAGEVCEALVRAGREGLKVRVAGSGHSFSDVVLTEGCLLVLDRMKRVLEVDRGGRLVRVEAGITLHELSAALAAEGLALPNLGDIDAQTLGGALATGTHGTGAGLPNLSAGVEAMTIARADGSLVACSAAGPEADLLRAARVSVGALGVVVDVTLRCVPAFNLLAARGTEPLGPLLDGLEGRALAAEHFEFFVFPHTDVALTRTNRRTERPAQALRNAAHRAEALVLENALLDASLRLGRRAPGLVPALNRLSTRFAGSSERVDRSDRVFASPRLVRFTETEYALPRAAGAPALRALLAGVRERALMVNFPVEVRFSAADDAWLSPSYGRESCYVAVHAYTGTPWREYFALAESIFAEHGGRPHWGKRHSLGATELAALYPEWARFQAARARLDPGGLFTTPAIERVLGAARGASRGAEA
ncbi:MAG TPA: D-arabinono-1,4-lactone oxidase [Polyangiaceae bacterium]|nr:D-arabinono-1,4-lactone oxidase [Polyangiaceae bacterium]